MQQVGYAAQAARRGTSKLERRWQASRGCDSANSSSFSSRRFRTAGGAASCRAQSAVRKMCARGSAVHSSNFRGAVVKRSHATAQWVQRTYPRRRTGSGDERADERRDRRGRPEELLQVDVPADSGGTAALACPQLGSLPSAQRTVHRCAPYSSECSALCTLAHEARASLPAAVRGGLCRNSSNSEKLLASPPRARTFAPRSAANGSECSSLTSASAPAQTPPHSGAHSLAALAASAALYRYQRGSPTAAIKALTGFRRILCTRRGPTGFGTAALRREVAAQLEQQLGRRRQLGARLGCRRPCESDFGCALPRLAVCLAFDSGV